MAIKLENGSQSPQTGQFNSYYSKVFKAATHNSLNPLKRVNSILTAVAETSFEGNIFSLNPLKRVNSILTRNEQGQIVSVPGVSIPSNGSIQFLP